MFSHCECNSPTDAIKWACVLTTDWVTPKENVHRCAIRSLLIGQQVTFRVLQPVLKIFTIVAKYISKISYNPLLTVLYKNQNLLISCTVNMIQKNYTNSLTKLSSALLSHSCLFIQASLTASLSWSKILSCSFKLSSLSISLPNSSWRVFQPTYKVQEKEKSHLSNGHLIIYNFSDIILYFHFYKVSHYLLLAIYVTCDTTSSIN